MRFNAIQFNNETRKARINSLKNIAYNAAEARFNAAKIAALEQFEEHKVSKELSDENSSNISQTLAGKGNLFSFIGFDSGSTPIEDVLRALELLISMNDTPTIIERGTKIIFNYKVKIPSYRTLYDLTPLPWDSGNSWLRGIENGISGFTEYIYWKNFSTSSSSRSGRGLQSIDRLRDGAFKPTPYISKILNDLKLKFTTK